MVLIFYCMNIINNLMAYIIILLVIIIMILYSGIFGTHLLYLYLYLYLYLSRAESLQKGTDITLNNLFMIFTVHCLSSLCPLGHGQINIMSIVNVSLMLFIILNAFLFNFLPGVLMCIMWLCVYYCQRIHQFRFTGNWMKQLVSVIGLWCNDNNNICIWP